VFLLRKVITSSEKCNHEGIMVRTQIQLTERQARELKRMAAREGVSMAEVIRRAVDAKIHEGAAEVPWEERVRRAMAATGTFRSGLKDVSKRHDRYVAEAYDDR
jgi:hypothetical protein